MVGKKLYKNSKADMAQYTATAQWCNANNAHIEDKGTYYEVCENVIPEPTKEEKLADLDNQFKIDRATIMEYYTQAVFDEDTETQEELKAEMEEIKATYAEERKAIEEE